MATISHLGSGTATGAGTTVSTGTISFAVNDWLVIFFAHSNSGTSGAAPGLTVDDSDGLNTYTERDELVYDPGGSGDGTVLSIYTCQVTDAVTNGSITGSFTDSPNSRTIQVYRIRPATNEVISFVSVGSGNTGGGVSSYSAGTVSVTNGNIIFGCASIETDDVATGDSDTTNGSWSSALQRTADNGADDDSTIQISQYKQVTATGNQTWTATTASTNAYAANYIIMRVRKTLTAGAGSYTVSGTTSSLERGRKLVAGGGSYAVSGSDASLSYTGAKIVNTESGSYAVNGTAASTLHQWKVAAAGGSYALTGTAAALKVGFEVAADAGTYALTGTAASLLDARKIAADGGSYAVSGTDVALHKSGAFAIAALAGSYALTGTAASLVHGLKIAAGGGSYAVSGTDATFRLDREVTAEAGFYEMAGTDASLEKTPSSPIPVKGTLAVSAVTSSLPLRGPSSLRVESHIHTLRVGAIWRLIR